MSTIGRVLDALSDGNAMTASQITEQLGIPGQAVRSALCHLKRSERVIAYSTKRRSLYAASAPMLASLTTVQHAIRTQPTSVFALGVAA